MVMAALLVIPSFWGTANAADAWDGIIATDYNGGDGSENTPFLIANGEQLAYLAQEVNKGVNYEGKYFKLTADIDLGGKDWTPIGDYDIDINLPFRGVFDGNNKTIDNLLINNPDTSCCGLFGCIYYGGVIKNLAVNGSVSATKMNVGGICGQNSMGTISNCSFSGSVIGQSSYVGGICGMNGNGTILNCINSAKVEGRDRVGGISESSGNSIQYCVNVGVVSGTGNNVGGVCGYYNNRSTVSDCYFDKSVNPGLSAYGNKDDEDTVKGLTTNELCGALPAKFIDSIWQEGSIDSANRKGTYISLINIGEPAEGKLPEYNFGTDDKPDMDIYTLITTPEQFKAIGESDKKWTENYVLGNDIDLGGAELTPIGNDTTHFTGKFSGDGHVVSNFVINTDGNYAGLFGYNEGKIVKVGVEKASVNAVSYVGAICGASKGTIRDCYNTSAVSGEDNIGGICGQNLTGGTITNCYNTGNVTGTYGEVGGVCGYNYSTVANCYNTGAISGRSSVGGVCGTSSESTTNCYNTGAVSGEKDDVGGVCGFNGSLMENCYSTGTVNGTKKVGGVCGTNTDTTTNCYYNKDVFSGNGSNSGEGGGTDTTIGLTTEELCDSKNTSFDYTNTWVEGSCIFESEESKPNFRTAKYTFPSLNGVGEAYTINKIEQYNFGTDDEPDWDVYTLITKPDDFKAIGDSGTDWDKNYVLGNDIVFADGTTELTPIGIYGKPFKGKFSGDGHVISNFVINKNDASDNYVGLFGYNEGKIMKVGVEKANVTGTMNAGGVCGQNIGTIRNCYNAATVSGGDYIGGVCGNNINDGTITNCYNTGEVSGTNYNTGGVCGLNLSTVTNCYNTGNVNGKTNVGGVCGANSGTITNCYYSTDTFSGNGIGTDTSTGSATDVTGLTTEKLCDKENTQSFDYENIWEPGRCDITPDMSSKFRTVTYVLPSLKGVGKAKEISDVKQYDFGYDNNTDWDIYTLITKPDDFKAIGDNGTGWDKNYVLGADIPFEGDQLTPIGNSSIAFKGKFSGDGHIISGFIINSPTSNSVGLFGSNLGLIENVGIKNAQVTGKSSVGGVCGQNDNNIKSSGIIKNCYNAGIVSGGNYIGGVCGENNGTVANCYNTNKVSGDSSIGGVCGMNRGTITNCYNTSDVSAADKWVGGVCGANGKNIENCYSTGAVSGTDAVGGVCGLNNGPMKNCYYNKDVCTNGNDSATGLTTIQMTDGNALTTMGFGADWSRQDIDKKNGIAYYPDLAVFADDKPSVKYETKLVIEPSDKNAEYKYGDEVKFNVSALVKFDGAADFAADTTAATQSKGSFTVTVDNDTVVDSTEIFDNTTAEAVIPSIKFTGDKTFTLVYDGTNSAYIKSGTATCEVSIAKLDLTADDFTFTVPTKLIYDGTAKEATVTVNDGITGVGIITVKYYMGDVETQPINAGDYTVKIDVAGNDIYNSAHDLTADGWKFTIAKAAQNIDAPAEYALTYGETGKITATTDGDGAISYKVTAGSDVISVAADGAVTVLKAGTATVEITAAETANYTQAAKTVNVTVSKVAVTIIANSYTIKVGETLPVYDYKVTGLVNDETLPIDVTISCAADGKTAGEFPITVSGAAESTNYTFSYTNGTLTVNNKETQTITADDVTLTYGETAKITASTDGDGAISYSVKTGDDVISVAADGTITALKAGTATVEITAAETDTYAKAVKAVTVTVNKAAVTITAKNYAIKVDDNLPAYDYEVTGLVNGEALPIEVTISCTADGKTAGEFPITVSGAAESTNYTFSYTNGTLTVNNKETQTITATDVTLTYGETAKITASTDGDGAISYAVTAGSDVISVAADGTITALKAGTATVEITAAETDTYAKAVKAVTVTVNKAAVTITAKNYAIKVGDNLPAYDYEVTVLVNGEALPIDVTISCAADGKTAGEFPITVSGAAESASYTFSYTNGTLTVNNKETQTITATDVTMTYGETAKITASTDGDGAISYSVKTGDDVISVAADGTITALKAGTATVEITAAETDTYAKAVKAVTVTVNKAAVTIKAKNYTIKKGGALPAFEYTVTGLVNGDTLAFAPALTCAANTNTVGTYDIIVAIEITEDERYTYATQNGTLTVENKSSGGSTGGTGGSGGRPALPSNSSDSANPAINGTSKDWKKITTDISNSAWNSSIIIQLNGNTTVPAEVIKAIADRDSSVLFVDSVFSWVVDGAKITEPVSANLTLIRTASIKSDGLRGTEGVQFRINSTGIPTDLEIAFRAEHAGKFANLFRNENGKQTFVTCAKIGADGKALLPEVTEAGNYIVMLGEFSDRPGDVNNDGVLNALDASAVLKEVVGLEAVANPIVADFNSNGTINALDASEILKKVVGLI